MLRQQQNLGRIFGTSRMHLSPPPRPSGFGCCLFWGGGFVVVDSLLIITPIVGFCNCSMFCWALLCVHSSFAIILDGEERAGCFALLVFLASCDFCVALPHNATGLSAVCHCGISWSYSLFWGQLLWKLFTITLGFAQLHYNYNYTAFEQSN